MIPDPESDPAVVQVGRFFPYPPSAVWWALTDPDAVARWLAPSTGFVGAVVGSQFLFSVSDSTSAEIACEVVAATPVENMTWSWMDMRASRPARWFVTWDVQAHGRGTRLMLTHTGFDMDDRMQKMARNAFARGWDQVLTTKMPVALRDWSQAQ